MLMGLLLSSDLSWSYHIETTCTKARKLLGLLYHQFCNTSPQVAVKLDSSLVRPHLEYRAQVCHPHLASALTEFGLSESDAISIVPVMPIDLHACRACSHDHEYWLIALYRPYKDIVSLSVIHSQINIGTLHLTSCHAQMMPLG